MKKVLLVTLILALSGCSTVLRTIAIEQGITATTTSIIIKHPVPEVASVGSYMITNGYFLKETTSFEPDPLSSNTIEMLHDINVVVPHKLREFTFHLPISTLSYGGQSQIGSAYAYNGDFYDKKNRKVTGGLILDKNDAPTHLYWLARDGNYTYAAPLNQPPKVIFKQAGKPNADTEDTPLSHHRTIHQHSTKALIYSGIKNGKISFTYREFSPGGSLNSLFTQYVTLDYSPGQEYAFQEARFRVLHADVADIEYELIQGFDIFTRQ